MMNKKLLRLPEVIQKTGMKKSWIYKLIGENKFPRQIKLGDRAVAWLESDVDKWIEQQVELMRGE